MAGSFTLNLSGSIEIAFSATISLAFNVEKTESSSIVVPIEPENLVRTERCESELEPLLELELERETVSETLPVPESVPETNSNSEPEFMTVEATETDDVLEMLSQILTSLAKPRPSDRTPNSSDSWPTLSSVSSRSFSSDRTTMSPPASPILSRGWSVMSPPASSPLLRGSDGTTMSPPPPLSPLLSRGWSAMSPPVLSRGSDWPTLPSPSFWSEYLIPREIDDDEVEFLYEVKKG